MVHVSLFHPLWVFAVERFWCPLGPELLATLVCGLGLCSAGIGGVRIILRRWYCRHFQFPTELHWLSADGVQGFPVVMVFDKEEGALRLLEVFIKTDSGWLVGKLQFYEPSAAISSRQLQPFRVRFGLVHLVHGQELSSLCIKFGQLLYRPVHDVKTLIYHWHCQGVDGFQFVCGVQLRLYYYYYLKFSTGIFPGEKYPVKSHPETSEFQLLSEDMCWYGLLLLTVTDVSTVIFRVKVSCIYHLSWLYYTLVIDLIGQLRHDVIGRLSVKPWCHWLWRLVISNWCVSIRLLSQLNSRLLLVKLSVL